MRATCLLLAGVLVLGCEAGGGGSTAGGDASPSSPSPPERIVSLVPSATQVLVALGQAERIVGRTDFDTTAALADVPSVGGGLQPDLERLVALAPDLVIRFAGPSDAATAEHLDRLGIAHLAVRPDRIGDVREIVHRLGTLTGSTARADSLVRTVDRDLDEVRRAVAGRPRVRAAYVLGGTPPWVAGPGTFIDELIRLAGGENVFSDLDRLYAPASPEELATRDVDVYLTSSGATVEPRLLRSAPVKELSARVQIPGPDLGEAAREVARALHPGALR